jgi:hypothetical protein
VTYQLSCASWHKQTLVQYQHLDTLHSPQTWLGVERESLTQSAVCQYFQLYGLSGMGAQTFPVCLDVVPFKVLAVSDKA